MTLFEKLQKMPILLIDDDEWIRDALSVFFKTKECCITTVETAEEGILEIYTQPYHILIVDYYLPGMNGIEFFKQIQTRHPSAVKILISAYDSSKIFSQAAAAGVLDIIEKPFHMGIVEASLTRLIDSCFS